MGMRGYWEPMSTEVIGEDKDAERARIADDIARFEEAGGKVERLANGDFGKERTPRQKQEDANSGMFAVDRDRRERRERLKRLDRGA